VISSDPCFHGHMDLLHTYEGYIGDVQPSSQNTSQKMAVILVHFNSPKFVRIRHLSLNWKHYNHDPRSYKWKQGDDLQERKWKITRFRHMWFDLQVLNWMTSGVRLAAIKTTSSSCLHDSWQQHHQRRHEVGNNNVDVRTIPTSSNSQQYSQYFNFIV
jgi:hypothetical protein